MHSGKLLDIQPSELQFPFELNKRLSCSLQLISKTDYHIAFKIRQPHIWGGEPELLMSSHVLQMPITVYMCDKKSGNLITIAEYGQEYGKEDPVRVLYHGYGHYDVLRVPAGGSQKFKKR